MTSSESYMRRAETASVGDGYAQVNAMLAIAAAVREQTEAIERQNEILGRGLESV